MFGSTKSNRGGVKRGCDLADGGLIIVSNGVS